MSLTIRKRRCECGVTTRVKPDGNFALHRRPDGTWH